MPVAFGSAGDIISVCLLIKDIVKALNESHGSSHSFQQLVSQLQALERTLLEVELLVHKHEASPELTALCVAAGQAARNCHTAAEPFFRRLQVYQQSLRRGGSRNKMKDTYRKIHWATLRKDEVDKSYAEVSAHTGSLNMLLITWSISMIHLHGSQTQQAFAAAGELERASNRTQEGLLRQILIRVDKAVFLSGKTNLALQKALSLTRLSWLRQWGSEVMAMMAKVQSVTFKTYTTVLSLNEKLTWLSSQVLLLHGTCTLIDALGRLSPLQVQFVDCWDALDAVLEVRFRGLPGYESIACQRYSLIDGHTGREMDRGRSLNTVLIPGQHINIQTTHNVTIVRLSMGNEALSAFRKESGDWLSDDTTKSIDILVVATEYLSGRKSPPKYPLKKSLIRCRESTFLARIADERCLFSRVAIADKRLLYSIPCAQCEASEHKTRISLEPNSRRHPGTKFTLQDVKFVRCGGCLSNGLIQPWKLFDRLRAASKNAVEVY